MPTKKTIVKVGTMDKEDDHQGGLDHSIRKNGGGIHLDIYTMTYKPTGKNASSKTRYCEYHKNRSHTLPTDPC